MPLTPGKSPKVVSSNISELAATGKYPQPQAVAIALHNAGKALTTATGTPITNPSQLAASQDLQVDKQTVHYTDQSTNPQEICQTCAFFVQPGGCQRVKGLIDPDGWCKLYDPDKADRLANWGRTREADAASRKERKLYQTPRPLGFFERFGKQLKAGLQVLRANDGARFMFSVTSNSYKDREGEAMTTKALARYVDSAWKGSAFVANQPVYFWHEDDLPKIGNVVWADMEGPFLIEVFKEAVNPFAKKVWDYVEAHPRDFGTSHGFDYPLAAQDDQGVYHDIDKFESSVLPHFAAANQYTVSTVIGEKSMGNRNEKDQYLDDKVLGRAGAAQQLRRVPKAMHKALTEAGIGHKEKGIADDMQAKLHDHIAKITADPELQGKLHQTIAAHHAEKAAMPAGEPDGDEGWDPAGDDMDADQEPMPNGNGGMRKEDSEGDGEAEEEQDVEDRRADEKSQPGYEPPDEGAPVMVPALVNSAITKQPGSFPPPVTQQERTGKSRYVTQDEFARGMKEIRDLGEAMREMVTIFDGNRPAPQQFQASSDPMTVVDNPAMLKAVKNINERVDDFWHHSLGS